MKALLTLLFLLTALVAHPQPARLIIIRHAEKPADERLADLSEEGRVRARKLVRWLAEGKVLGTNGAPSVLIAARPTARGRSLRCEQTLQPTAEHLKLPIRTTHFAEDYARLARAVLQDASLRSKTVVICWTHNELPDLAAAFGVKPKPSKWKDKDYDSAYILTFADGHALLEKTKQKLEKD